MKTIISLLFSIYRKRFRDSMDTFAIVCWLVGTLFWVWPIKSWHSVAEAFTTWTRTGEVTKRTAPLVGFSEALSLTDSSDESWLTIREWNHDRKLMIVTDYILPTTKKRIKYYRQLGNFLDRHRTVKLYDIRAVSEINFNFQ